MSQRLMPARLHAPAKLTAYLHVTGTRDDGYHLIEAEMLSLDLADELEISEGDGLEVAGMQADRVPAGSDNLIGRALQLLNATAFVRLTKRIPTGAGLGGGSADAGAILRWGGLDDPEKATRLGADVPFCVRGGRAKVTGIGEQLSFLSYEERKYTLLTPPFGVDTVAVYRAYDSGVRSGPAWSEGNHLQAAALEVEPRLGFWRELLYRHTGELPVLAGSGSTWFVRGAWHEPPADLPEGAHWVVATTTRGDPDT